MADHLFAHSTPVLSCSHFSPKSSFRLISVLSTLEDELPPLQAASPLSIKVLKKGDFVPLLPLLLASAEGVGESIPLSLSVSASVLCPEDVYPGSELAALSGLGLPPIILSLNTNT